MLKKICDCCGNEVNVETKFKLPSYTEVAAYNKGVKMVSFTHIKETDMDLCDCCIVNIANFLDVLKYNNNTNQ